MTVGPWQGQKVWRSNGRGTRRAMLQAVTLHDDAKAGGRSSEQGSYSRRAGPWWSGTAAPRLLHRSARARCTQEMLRFLSQAPASQARAALSEAQREHQHA